MSCGAGNPLFFNEVEQAIFGLPCIWHGLMSELTNSILYNHVSFNRMYNLLMILTLHCEMESCTHFVPF